MAQRSKLMHRSLAVVWTALIIPTLAYWAESIRWVLLISIYANIASHLGAAEAADDHAVLDRLDRLESLVVTGKRKNGPLRASVRLQNRGTYTRVTKRYVRRSVGFSAG